MHKLYPSLLATIALAAILLVAEQTSAQTLLWDMITVGNDINSVEDYWEVQQRDADLVLSQQHRAKSKIRKMTTSLRMPTEGIEIITNYWYNPLGKVDSIQNYFNEQLDYTEWFDYNQHGSLIEYRFAGYINECGTDYFSRDTIRFGYDKNHNKKYKSYNSIHGFEKYKYDTLNRLAGIYDQNDQLTEAYHYQDSMISKIQYFTREDHPRLYMLLEFAYDSSKRIKSSYKYIEDQLVFSKNYRYLGERLVIIDVFKHKSFTLSSLGFSDQYESGNTTIHQYYDGIKFIKIAKYHPSQSSFTNITYTYDDSDRLYQIHDQQKNTKTIFHYDYNGRVIAKLIQYLSYNAAEKYYYGYAEDQQYFKAEYAIGSEKPYRVIQHYYEYY